MRREPISSLISTFNSFMGTTRLLCVRFQLGFDDGTHRLVVSLDDGFMNADFGGGHEELNVSS